MKAQMEVFGLIIIVIIISVVMLIYMSNSIEDSEENPREILKDYAFNELSTSFLSTLLQTNVPQCPRGTAVEDLIKDCGTYGVIRCGRVSSCDKIHEVIQTLLDDTLLQWNYPYELSLTYPGEEWDDPKQDFEYETGEFHNVQNQVGSTLTFGKLYDDSGKTTNTFRYGTVDEKNNPDCGKGVMGLSPPAFFPIPLYKNGEPAIMELGICK